MNTIFKFLTLTLPALFLIGCSSVQVSQDYDATANFNHIKTFQWQAAGQQTKPKAADFEKKDPLIAERIRIAIKAQLALQGFSLVDNHADAFITYHISSVQKVRSNVGNVSIGFGTGFGSSSYGSIGFQSAPDIQQYQEGLLIIDIISKDGKLLWRGNSSTALEEHPTPADTTKLIQEVVQKLLMQYPPDKKKAK